MQTTGMKHKIHVINNRNKQKLPDLDARNIFLGGMLAKRATKYRKQNTMNSLTTATRAINGEKQSPSQTKPCPYTRSNTLDVTTNSLQSICKTTNQGGIHYRTISVCPLPRLQLQTFIFLKFFFFALESGEEGMGKQQIEHARPMSATFLQTYHCMTRSRTQRTLQQQVLVRTKTAFKTSNKIPTAIHTPRSTKISLKISSPTMFSQHRLVAHEVLLLVEWLDGTDDGVYNCISLQQVSTNCISLQQICTR